MKYEQLGDTDISFSKLGYGTIQLTNLTHKESKKLIEYAYERGINWFDTARDYFDSEKNLGYAVKTIRNHVNIISKSQKLTSEGLINDLEKSLKVLKTDYLDIFLFHKGHAIVHDDFITAGGLLETLEKEVEKGKIRYLGYSAHSLEIAYKGLGYPSLKAVMVPVNFISTEYVESEFMEKSQENNIGVLGMKPFGGGRIPDKKLCIKYLKKHENVFPCLGIKSIEELENNLLDWDQLGSLTETDLKQMGEISNLLGKKFCRGCGYCMPCPKGIDIPTIAFLKIHMMQLPHEKLYSKEFYHEVEKVKKCIKCKGCIKRCPYGLEIINLIRENANFYYKVFHNR